MFWFWLYVVLLVVFCVVRVANKEDEKTHGADKFIDKEQVND